MKDMIRRNMIPYFDYELQQVMNSGDFWVEAMDDLTPVFPRPHVSEITDVQPFFACFSGRL